jgi:hypothetical protein
MVEYITELLPHVTLFAAGLGAEQRRLAYALLVAISTRMTRTIGKKEK